MNKNFEFKQLLRALRTGIIDEATFEQEMKHLENGAHSSNGNGAGDAYEGADPGLQTRAGELDGAKDEREFSAFTQNHQKNEEKYAPACGGAGARGINLDFFFYFIFQVARNAVHPYDHRNDEEGGDQHQEAFEAVLVDMPVFECDGDGQAECGRGGDAKPNETREMGPAGARQINEDNAYYERGFDTFTEGDKKGREQRVSNLQL